MGTRGFIATASQLGCGPQVPTMAVGTGKGAKTVNAKQSFARRGQKELGLYWPGWLVRRLGPCSVGYLVTTVRNWSKTTGPPVVMDQGCSFHMVSVELVRF